MTADYAEQTDAQKATLSGTNRALSYRATEAISFVDLGLEWGTYAVSGESNLHEVEVSSDYVNLLVGVTFRLFPGWVQYSLDYGYRLGVDRVKLDRTTSSGKVNRHKIGGFSEEPFTRFGIRFLLGQNLFVGLSAEQQSQLFDKSKDSMYPAARSAKSKLSFWDIALVAEVPEGGCCQRYAVATSTTMIPVEPIFFATLAETSRVKLV